jgi:hypothetical protein
METKSTRAECSLSAQLRCQGIITGPSPFFRSWSLIRFPAKYSRARDAPSQVPYTMCREENSDHKIHCGMGMNSIDSSAPNKSTLLLREPIQPRYLFTIPDPSGGMPPWYFIIRCRDHPALYETRGKLSGIDHPCIGNTIRSLARNMVRPRADLPQESPCSAGSSGTTTTTGHDRH